MAHTGYNNHLNFYFYCPVLSTYIKNVYLRGEGREGEINYSWNFCIAEMIGLVEIPLI